MTAADAQELTWARKITEKVRDHDRELADLRAELAAVRDALVTTSQAIEAVSAFTDSISERLDSVHRAAIREATRRMTPVKPKGRA